MMAEPLVKFSGRAHRVLPDHGVGDEQYFGGIQLALEVRQLVHQLIVNVQAAGGVHQDHVARGQFGFADRAAYDFERLVRSRARPAGRARGFGHLRELLTRCGTVHVGRDDDWAVAVLREPFASFPVDGGFTGALQAARSATPRAGARNN